MIILSAIWIYFTFFLFTWYSAKLLRDIKGLDQYWHLPQMYFLIGIYLLPYIMTWQLDKLLFCFIMGLQFPFIFNTVLNIYRINAGANITWKHLGKYDFLKFWQTVVLFIIGLIGLILIIVKEFLYGNIF